ncbi:NAD-dependent epimerase/dehydratase family protein [Bacillus sp. EB106-08-02-XG196]|uniref:NAD-dependent epimerase/dehydratase family protein n=1 Tax=Bacillus sp. EB106-08-02-XG196 TaxID=2737049 RepID=UPI0015C437C4|nr:NAD-dependent epimerase/dehydratase family protein [Bacillus sp. EB106-08-02-XG196]NWQ43194.1 NAD-dependent epimerase/dehydratase family protein [Bacillus sp. EB106-08-02-XG196]
MKSALILGGTQFVGKRLVQLLVDEGVEVTIATRGLTPDSFGHQVNRLIINRENAESLGQAFKDEKWDVVFDQTCYSSQEALDSLKTLNGRVKKYIFTSSQAVYDFGTNSTEEGFNPMEFQPVLKSRREYIGYVGYQEAKRAAEAILFQNADFPIVAVRFPIIIGKDDYTNRLKFHVEHVKEGKPMFIEHPTFRYSFIDSEKAAAFLLSMAKSDYHGPINPGSEEDISLGELNGLIEELIGTKAILSVEGDPSPYNLPGSWSVNTSLAQSMGFSFSSLDNLLKKLIHHYS